MLSKVFFSTLKSPQKFPNIFNFGIVSNLNGILGAALFLYIAFSTTQIVATKSLLEIRNDDLYEKFMNLIRHSKQYSTQNERKLNILIKGYSELGTFAINELPNIKITIDKYEPDKDSVFHSQDLNTKNTRGLEYIKVYPNSNRKINSNNILPRDDDSKDTNIKDHLSGRDSNYHFEDKYDLERHKDMKNINKLVRYLRERPGSGADVPKTEHDLKKIYKNKVSNTSMWRNYEYSSFEHDLGNDYYNLSFDHELTTKKTLRRNYLTKYIIKNKPTDPQGRRDGKKYVWMCPTTPKPQNPYDKLSKSLKDKLNELTEFLTDHQYSLLYMYSEMLRIKSTGQIKDEIRKYLDILELPKNKKLRQKAIQCTKQVLGPDPVSTDTWNIRPNNLIIDDLNSHYS